LSKIESQEKNLSFYIMYVPDEEDTIYCHLCLISLFSFLDANPAEKSYFFRKYLRDRGLLSWDIPSKIMGRGCQSLY